MRHAYIVLLLLGLYFTDRAQAQSNAPTETAYLLRMERASYQQTVCVLLNGNGQYHVERHTLQKVRVFEGSLNAAELRDIIHIVSGDRLFNLE